MEAKQMDIAVVIKRLENELALQVECDDPKAALTLACDIQALINRYKKAATGMHYAIQLNNQHKETIVDLREELRRLNLELDRMREAID